MVTVSMVGVVGCNEGSCGNDEGGCGTFGSCRWLMLISLYDQSRGAIFVEDEP